MSDKFQYSGNDLVRVLVLVDRAVANSGPHRNVVSSLNALSRRTDVDLRLLCHHYDHKAPFARNDEIDIRVGFDPHAPAKLIGNLNALYHAAADRDVVYVPSGLKAFLYAFGTKIGYGCKLVAGPNVAGIPYLMSIYDPGPLMTTTMTDGWIEMSVERVRRCIRSGTDAEEINLVPHAVDLELFSPDRSVPELWERWNLDPSRLKVLHVGRFNERRKGTALLFETFERIGREVDDVDLIIIGPDGPLLDGDMLRKSNVHYLGAVYGPALAECYASADVFLGTSLYETFWFPPLEAMASGTPAVVTRTGAVPRMIRQQGKQGFGIEFRQQNGRLRSDVAKRLAKPAIQLLRSTELREQIGREARTRAEAAFSEERLGRQLVELFREVVFEGSNRVAPSPSGH